MERRRWASYATARQLLAVSGLCRSGKPVRPGGAALSTSRAGGRDEDLPKARSEQRSRNTRGPCGSARVSQDVSGFFVLVRLTLCPWKHTAQCATVVDTWPCKSGVRAESPPRGMLTGAITAAAVRARIVCRRHGG